MMRIGAALGQGGHVLRPWRSDEEGHSASHPREEFMDTFPLPLASIPKGHAVSRRCQQRRARRRHAVEDFNDVVRALNWMSGHGSKGRVGEPVMKIRLVYMRWLRRELFVLAP